MSGTSDFTCEHGESIGVCDKCGSRYFSASIPRRVAEIGRGTIPKQRTREVSVDRYYIPKQLGGKWPAS